MKAITSNTTLKARSACDYNCIFTLKVIERKGSFAMVDYNGKTRRVKVRIDSDGNEFLIPDNYSMAPIFRA